MFVRDASNQLLRWFSKENRKPLVIRGARQVGKTGLVRLFAETNNIKLIEINLEELKIYEFEKEDQFDVDRAISEIEALTNKKIDKNSVLFIDEIQESKMAYSRLRFFKEKRPDIPVIVAGSLLEVELKKSNQNAPVGRLEFLFLGPMTFQEFLQANNENILTNEIKSIDFNKPNTINESVHNKIIDYLRDYFFVGGMPEAVQSFVNGGKDYLAARSIQEDIFESYRQDVRKYADGKISEVILEVFDKMAFEIGKKVKYNRFSSEKSSYIKQAINILDDIFILQKVYHSDCNGLPLKKTENSNIYKLYILDVGIYNCLMGTTFNDLISLNNTDLLNKGDIAEQFIAQHLYLDSFKTKSPRLYYWLRDKQSEKAEVDFTSSDLNSIIPIEIKAGKSGKIKSLIQFMYEKHNILDFAVRYDIAYREEFTEELSFKLKTKDAVETVNFKLNNRPLYSI